MSLVGSLEDLGLGDILQIVSLSRKSGLLLIRSEAGEGRIIFCDGLVRAAYVKGEPDNLRSLLVEADFVSAEAFDRAVELAEARGVPVAEILPECTSLTRESLDSLRREQVERAVFRMFSWETGEFSFEVRDEIEPRDHEILISTGINAQYLTMEATRLGDEGSHTEPEETEPEPPVAAIDDAPLFFSGENAPDESEAAQEVDEARADRVAIAEPLDAACESRAVADVAVAADDRASAAAQPNSNGEAEAVLAFAAVQKESPELEPEPLASESAATRASEAPATRASERGAPPRAVAATSLIAIDPNLSTLEWQKLHLAETFRRVHIFQSGERGIERIRQYLRRGTIPIVLVSIDLATERVSGVDSLAEFIRRLKILAPSMPVLVSRYDEAQCDESTDAADAILTGPDPAVLVDRKAWPKLSEHAERFREEVSEWLEQPANQTTDTSHSSGGTTGSAADGSENLKTLRAVSEQIRDPANHGDVLKLVLQFAAESFSRVAMFMVRDDVALGVAQIGLPGGGGPDDARFREVDVPVSEVESFRHVLETRSSSCGPAAGDGDRALMARIGSKEPEQVYCAPIISGGRVVALLYADNLPGGEPIGDTSVIEIALHEAGLALERALLQRALAQIGDSSAI